MPKYGFLVVEGPHDVEFVYRLLNPFGLERVRLEKDLDDFMQPLVPRTFPHGGDLEKRGTSSTVSPKPHARDRSPKCERRHSDRKSVV